MSTPQRTRACVTLVVDRTTADVLRLEAKKILLFEHDLFADYLDLDVDAQYELAMRFHDAIELISTVGWAPDDKAPKADKFQIAFTDDLIKQLARGRADLAATNRDRLSNIEDGEPIPAEVMAEVTVDRNAAAELDRVIAAYTVVLAG